MGTKPAWGVGERCGDGDGAPCIGLCCLIFYCLFLLVFFGLCLCECECECTIYSSWYLKKMPSPQEKWPRAQDSLSGAWVNSNGVFGSWKGDRGPTSAGGGGD